MKRRLLVAALLLLAGAGFFAYSKYRFRYVWPSRPIASMQELPPPDRSSWPAEPVPWTRTTETIATATPQGIVLREITYHTNSIGMDFLRVEPGSYVTGNRSLILANHNRRHKRQPGYGEVSVTRPYYLGAFEVTNAQFELFAPERAQRRPRYQRGKDGGDHPVEPVTWRQAQEFARWLSAKEGRLYRLPTEAEWELACRAGTTERFYWGEAYWDGGKANFGGLHSNRETATEDWFRQTAPVGRYPANPWGFYDMLGNAFEWVQDWYHEPSRVPVTDPAGPAEGRCRMGKGGSWTTRPYRMFCGERDGNNPADVADIRGFRLWCETGPGDGGQ